MHSVAANEQTVSATAGKPVAVTLTGQAPGAMSYQLRTTPDYGTLDGVNGNAAYDAGTRTARFWPAAPLKAAQTYTARVSGIKDLAGNAMSATRSWTFTKASTGSLPAPLVDNFGGMWWAAPAASESGWGINFAHQGDTIFATWFTYGLDGKPLWLVVGAVKSGPNVYTGTLYTGTGPPFNATPFDPTKVSPVSVGTATFAFTEGTTAAFTYSLYGVTQTKTITREVFAPPGMVCD